MLLDAVCYLSLATYCSLAELFLPHTSLFSFVIVPYNHDIAQKCYEISRVTSVSRMIIFKHSLLMGSQPRIPWKSIRDSSKLPAEIRSSWTHAWAGSIDTQDLLTVRIYWLDLLDSCLDCIYWLLGLDLLTVRTWMESQCFLKKDCYYQNLGNSHLTLPLIRDQLLLLSCTTSILF